MSAEVCVCVYVCALIRASIPAEVARAACAQYIPVYTVRKRAMQTQRKARRTIGEKVSHTGVQTYQCALQETVQCKYKGRDEQQEGTCMRMWLCMWLWLWEHASSSVMRPVQACQPKLCAPRAIVQYIPVYAESKRAVHPSVRCK
jgi:hypothetical protein